MVTPSKKRKRTPKPKDKDKKKKRQKDKESPKRKPKAKEKEKKKKTTRKPKKRVKTDSEQQYDIDVDDLHSLTLKQILFAKGGKISSAQEERLVCRTLLLAHPPESKETTSPGKNECYRGRS